jgi:hypothetical protein
LIVVKNRLDQDCLAKGSSKRFAAMDALFASSTAKAVHDFRPASHAAKSPHARTVLQQSFKGTTVCSCVSDAARFDQ